MKIHLYSKVNSANIVNVDEKFQSRRLDFG